RGDRFDEESEWAARASEVSEQLADLNERFDQRWSESSRGRFEYFGDDRQQFDPQGMGQFEEALAFGEREEVFADVLDQAAQLEDPGFGFGEVFAQRVPPL